MYLLTLIQFPTDHHSECVKCSKCSKSWCVMFPLCHTKKDYENQPLLCLSCDKVKMAKRNKENEESDTEISIERFSKLSKHDNLNRKINYTQSFDPNTNNKIKDLIFNHIISETEVDTQFDSFDEAENWFTTRLAYCYNTKNLLEFVHPFEETTTKKQDPIPNQLSFNMYDVRSLLYASRPSINAINFCLQCLNFYTFYSTTARKAPEVIFGTVNDHKDMTPSKFSYPDIFEHLNVPESDELEIDTRNCRHAVMDWFSKNDKNFVTLMLDYLEAQKLRLKNYMTIVPTSASHFVVLRVDFNQRSNYCYSHSVTSSDLFNLTETEINNWKVWFAKYFGLIVANDVKQEYCLEKTDFDCHDVKKFLSSDYNTYNIDKSSSILAQTILVNPNVYKDVNNSGLYCVLQCLGMINDSDPFSSEAWKKESNRGLYLEDFRLSILSLMAEMYETINKKDYDKFEDHLIMNYKVPDTNDDDSEKIVLKTQSEIRKWFNIHTLFRLGKFKYKKKNTNANSIFNIMSIKEINQMINISKVPKKRKATEPLSIGQKEKKLQKEQKQNRDDAQLKKFFLQDFIHSRIRPFFDVSNKTMILDVTNNYKPVKDINTINYKQLIEDNSASPSKQIRKVSKKMSKYFIQTRPHGVSKDQLNLFVVKEQVDTKLARNKASPVKQLSTNVRTAAVASISKQQKSPEKSHVSSSFNNERPITLKKTPNELVDEAIDLFYSRWSIGNETEKEIIDLKKSYRDTAMKHKLYFLMQEFDIDDTLDTEYHMMCAMVVEEDLAFSDASIAIIHLIACEFDYENDHYMRTLLYTVFNQKCMNNKVSVVVLCKVGDCHYIKRPHDEMSASISPSISRDKDTQSSPETVASAVVSALKTKSGPSIEEFFKTIDFQKMDVPAVKRFTAKNSHYMLGQVNNIRGMTKVKKVVDDMANQFRNHTHKICLIENSVKVKFRYNSEHKKEKDRYEVYSHPYGWHSATAADNKIITSSRRDLAKMYSDEPFYLRGGGARTENEDKSSIFFNKSYAIDDMFKQQTYDDKGSHCVWLSTCILIAQTDPSEAKYMIDLFVKDQPHFEWLVFSSYRSAAERIQSEREGRETLQDLLQQQTFYQLKKVKKPEGHQCYLESLLSGDIQGKFIVQLVFDNGDNTHTVGIDTVNCVIFDYMEPYGMVLNKHNLSMCGGSKSSVIDHVPLIREILKSKKSRKSK